MITEINMHKAKIATRKEAGELIKQHKPFRASAMRAHLTTSRTLAPGYLPAEWLQAYIRDRPTYVVISYDTPIAWWSDERGWVIPNVFYSHTTSKHQTIVRRAVGEGK